MLGEPVDRDVLLSRYPTLMLPLNEIPVYPNLLPSSSTMLWSLGVNTHHIFSPTLFEKSLPVLQELDHQPSTRPTSRPDRRDAIAKRDRHRDAANGGRGAGSSAVDGNMSTQDRQIVEGSVGIYVEGSVNGCLGGTKTIGCW